MSVSTQHIFGIHVPYFDSISKSVILHFMSMYICNLWHDYDNPLTYTFANTCYKCLRTGLNPSGYMYVTLLSDPKNLNTSEIILTMKQIKYIFSCWSFTSWWLILYKDQTGYFGSCSYFVVLYCMWFPRTHNDTTRTTTRVTVLLHGSILYS